MANIVRFPVGPRESVGAFAGPALVIPVLKAVRGRRGTAIAEYSRFCAGAEAGFQSLRAVKLSILAVTSSASTKPGKRTTAARAPARRAAPRV
jgi:hypothetical protein